jgi:hypothetical protein
LAKKIMKTEKRPRGRPKKKEGTIDSSHFFRAGMIISAYDEARTSGQKHSAAVTHAVDYVRQHCPKMPVSETEVKRTLATFRPRESQTTLRFKSLTLDDEKVARLRGMLEQVPIMRDKDGQLVPPPSIQNLLHSRTAYTFGYAERPVYPRHNRKIPNQ